jgi:hypothetical protein
MDLEALEFPKQPKVGISLYVEQSGKVLLGKRLRDPGKGIVNFYTHKVRFNEPLLESAKNCLQIETGLEADFVYAGTVRIINPRTDVLFVCFKTINIRGKLIEKTEEQENCWYTFEEVKKLENVFPEFKRDLVEFRKDNEFFKEVVERE